jgi:hypothetical protein
VAHGSALPPPPTSSPYPAQRSHCRPTIIALSIAARHHRPAPVRIPLPPTSSPAPFHRRPLPLVVHRALAPSTTRCLPLPPPPSLRCPRPQRPLPPTRSAVSRCESGARYPWKAMRDEFQGALARGRAGTADAAPRRPRPRRPRPRRGCGRPGHGGTGPEP